MQGYIDHLKTTPGGIVAFAGDVLDAVRLASGRGGVGALTRRSACIESDTMTTFD